MENDSATEQNAVLLDTPEVKNLEDLRLGESKHDDSSKLRQRYAAEDLER